MVNLPSIWTTGSTEAIHTGTWRASMPHYVKAPAPCHQACPVNGEIADWIGHARARDWRAAWEVLSIHNPFPAIAGRICHHPCETACNRATYDAPLAICKLERTVGDIALAQRTCRPCRGGRRRTVGPVGRLPVAPARVAGEPVRTSARVGRADALRHTALPAGT